MHATLLLPLEDDLGGESRTQHRILGELQPRQSFQDRAFATGLISNNSELHLRQPIRDDRGWVWNIPRAVVSTDQDGDRTTGLSFLVLLHPR